MALIPELLTAEARWALEVLAAAGQVRPRPVLDVIAIGQFLRYQPRAILDEGGEGLAVNLVDAAQVELLPRVFSSLFL